MKKLITIAATLFFFVANSQIYQPATVTQFGVHNNRSKNDSILGIPRKDTILTNAADTFPHITVPNGSGHDSIFVFYNKGKWYKFFGTTGSSANFGYVTLAGKQTITGQKVYTPSFHVDGSTSTNDKGGVTIRPNVTFDADDVNGYGLTVGITALNPDNHSNIHPIALQVINGATTALSGDLVVDKWVRTKRIKINYGDSDYAPKSLQFRDTSGNVGIFKINNDGTVCVCPDTSNVGNGHKFTVDGDVYTPSIANASNFDSSIYIDGGVLKKGLTASAASAPIHDSLSTLGLQRILINGSILTQNNTIDIGSNLLNFQGSNQIRFLMDGHPNGYLNIDLSGSFGSGGGRGPYISMRDSLGVDILQVNGNGVYTFANDGSYGLLSGQYKSYTPNNSYSFAYGDRAIYGVDNNVLMDFSTAGKVRLQNMATGRSEYLMHDASGNIISSGVFATAQTVGSLSELDTFNTTASVAIVTHNYTGGLFYKSSKGTDTLYPGMREPVANDTTKFWYRMNPLGSGVVDVKYFFNETTGKYYDPSTETQYTGYNAGPALNLASGYFPHRNGAVFVSGVLMSTDSVFYGEGTVFYGNNTLFPSQTNPSLIRYLSQNAIYVYGTNLFVPVDWVVDYRNQHPIFRHFGIFGDGQSSGHTAIVGRQNLNSTTTLHTVGLLEADGMYIDSMYTGFDARGAGDSWNIHDGQISRTIYPIRSGISGTYITGVDLYADSILAELNGTNDVVRGNTFEYGYHSNRYDTISTAIVVNSTAVNFDISGNYGVYLGRAVHLLTGAANGMVYDNQWKMNDTTIIVDSAVANVGFHHNLYRSTSGENPMTNKRFMYLYKTNEVAVEKERMQCSGCAIANLKPIYVNSGTNPVIEENDYMGLQSLDANNVEYATGTTFGTKAIVANQTVMGRVLITDSANTSVTNSMLNIVSNNGIGASIGLRSVGSNVYSSIAFSKDNGNFTNQTGVLTSDRLGELYGTGNNNISETGKRWRFFVRAPTDWSTSSAQTQGVFGFVPQNSNTITYIMNISSIGVSIGKDSIIPTNAFLHLGAGTTAKVPLRIDGGAAPSSPVGGQAGYNTTTAAGNSHWFLNIASGYKKVALIDSLSFPVGSVPYADAAGSLSRVNPGTQGQVLATNGTGNAPAFINVPIIAASGTFTAQTSGQTVTSYSVGNADSSFQVSGYITVTSVTLDVVQLQVTYTDETNAVITAVFYQMGSTTPGLSVTGKSNYPVMGSIRAKANTTITVSTILTTSTGSISYNTGAKIIKLP